MSPKLDKKTSDLRKITSAIFGSDELGNNPRLSQDSNIYQSFVTVIGFIHEWRMKYINLSKDEIRQFEMALRTGSDVNIGRKSTDLTSALMHLSFAKIGYEKLVNLIFENGSDEAHETLEALKSIFEEEINIMNRTKYEFTMPSPSSTQGRHPAGRNARAQRPLGRG